MNIILLFKNIKLYQWIILKITIVFYKGLSNINLASSREG